MTRVRSAVCDRLRSSKVPPTHCAVLRETRRRGERSQTAPNQVRRGAAGIRSRASQENRAQRRLWTKGASTPFSHRPGFARLDYVEGAADAWGSCVERMITSASDSQFRSAAVPAAATLELLTLRTCSAPFDRFTLLRPRTGALRWRPDSFRAAGGAVEFLLSGGGGHGALRGLIYWTVFTGARAFFRRVFARNRMTSAPVIPTAAGPSQ